MMSRGFSILFFVAALHACSPDFSIDAEIGSDAYDGVTVYMIRKHPVERSEDFVMDSTVIAGGRYSFSCPVTDGSFIAGFELAPKDTVGHTVFYYDIPDASCVVEPGKVSLIYTEYGVSVSGTPWNEDYERLVLAPSRQARASSAEYVDRTSLSDSVSVFYERIKPDFVSFIRKYAGTGPGITLFFSRSRQFYADSLYAELCSSVPQEYIAMEQAGEKRRRAEMEAEAAAKKMVRVGNPYVDFISRTFDGETVRLSDFVRPGHVTLLDFWASWCRPCRAEIPELKRLYEKYHEAGLQIISVSLDTDKDAWSGAVAEENMPWPQWSVLEGFESSSAKAYAVHSIPFVVLIDADGKIALVNIHGQSLEDKIRESVAVP